MHHREGHFIDDAFLRGAAAFELSEIQNQGFFQSFVLSARSVANQGQDLVGRAFCMVTWLGSTQLRVISTLAFWSNHTTLAFCTSSAFAVVCAVVPRSLSSPVVLSGYERSQRPDTRVRHN